MQKLLILLLVFLFACNKNEDNETTFKGVVFDYSSNQRLAAATVQVVLSGASGTVYSHSVTTGANGEYEIKLSVPPGHTIYNVLTKKEGFVTIENICKGTPIGKLFNYSQFIYNDTIYEDKQTIVNLNLNNIPPANTNDTLLIRLTHGNTCSVTPLFIQVIIAKEIELKGAINGYILSDTFSLKEAPLVKATWSVRNNGIVSNGEQQITATEFRTTNQVINY